MDCQMMSGEKSILNKNGETFGFSSDDYQSFVTSYSELSYAMAHNDYNLVSLFYLVREQIGKKSFSKLLIEGLRFTQSEISDLNRKLAAFQQIPDQIVWNTIGYRGIHKIMSMPVDVRERLLRDINEQGDNLTLKQFTSLCGKYSKDRIQDRVSSRDWNQPISLNRSDLERIVRCSVENVMGIKTQNKGKRSKSQKKFSGSKMSQFSFRPMTV